ncbi:FadR family transcriptional regulator [Actinomycetaceae bacterium WB03_NA08]|uniref:FadR family transcriptional regulator n=1 Tax=Scrofimicrobium canadense TaxID=2652290 RepID=A0A6N7W8N6_9ACTO|nr:FadR/GntR family transcriptional regulator [Scrofimicrobium canadense]MSS84636.1 FadR family transcriptional regulator [Scrofimicrobium canadense]
MRVSLTQQAQDGIREYIAENSLQPGDALPSEGAFSELFSMSKATVREAVRQLEMLGIVQAKRGKGLYVGEFTFDPVLKVLPYQLRIDDTPLLEILQVRAALEQGMVTRAAQLLSEDDLTALDDLVEKMRETSHQGDIPPEIDRQFHMTLFAPLNNVLLNRLIELFWQIYSEFAAETETPVNQHVVDDHAEIVAAIRSGDPQRMTRAIAVHFAPISTAIELKDSDVVGYVSLSTKESL